MGKMRTYATKGHPLQVGGCIGGNICFRCDSRLTGAVVYRKDLIKADTFRSNCVQKNLENHSCLYNSIPSHCTKVHLYSVL